MAHRSYRDFVGWQKAMQLCVAVYELTRQLPREEVYGLSSQIKRASVSVISNIAEGHGRGSRAQLANFLSMARGSVFEVEAQLLLCVELGFGDSKARAVCQSLCGDVGRILSSTLRSLQEPPKHAQDAERAVESGPQPSI